MRGSIIGDAKRVLPSHERLMRAKEAGARAEHRARTFQRRTSLALTPSRQFFKRFNP